MIYLVPLLVSVIGALRSSAIRVDTATLPPFVAEGSIQGSDNNTVVLLPVTIHGQAGTVILDVGAIAGLGMSSAAATFGIPLDGSPLDSLTLGTVVERDIPTIPLGLSFPIPSGMPPLVGILGTTVLSHYELLFNGPMHQVQLYQFPPSAPGHNDSHGPWLPAGLTLADCMPMPVFQNTADGWVGLPLRVNGYPITSVFDSGSPTSDMNLSAARLLGLTQHSSNVHRLPDSLVTSYPVGGGKELYTVTDLVLQLGTHQVTPVPVRIVTQIPVDEPKETPLLFLGLDAFRDRILLVSYQTRQVCLSPARKGVLGVARSVSSRANDVHK